MNLFDNTNLIEITKDDLDDAAISAQKVEKEDEKRALANVLGARLGIKFLKTLDIKASNFESIYTIPAVLKDLDIADICVNNIKIDVRIVQDENHLFVPKAQFDLKITPDVYLFMKLAPDFSYGEFIGVISPEEINKNIENENYYFISKENLYNANSLKNVLSKNKPASNIELEQTDILKAESLMINFIDGDIDKKSKLFVYEILKSSQEFRNIFKDFQNFEVISKTLANTEEILSDAVLDIIGTQKLYTEELTDEDFAKINLDEIAEDTAASFVEDFIEDESEGIDLMDNQNIIEGEFEELPEDNVTETIEEPGTLEPLPSDEELASFANFEQDTLENEVEDADGGLTFVEPTNFEGFEGLEANMMGDTTTTPEEAFNNLDEASNKGFEIAGEPNTTVENQNEETNFDFNSIDDTTETINDVEIQQTSLENEEHQFVLEDLKPIDLEDDNSQEVIDSLNYEQMANEHNMLENFTEPSKDTISKESSITEDTISETVDITDSAENNSLEEISAKTDMDEFNNNLPELEEISNEEISNEELSNEENLSDNTLSEIDDKTNIELGNDTNNQISSEINDEYSIELPNDANDEINSNSEMFDNNSSNLEENETIDLTGFEVATEISDENISTDNFEILENSETAHSEENEDNDDFSGLEEFTMDMASAVEEANPNIRNSQIPEDERLEYNQNFASFGETQEQQLQPVKGSDISKFLNEENEKKEEKSEDNSSTINFDDFNLDDLDDLAEQAKNSDDNEGLVFTDDSSSSDQETINKNETDNNFDLDSEIENIVHSNININNINLDEMDFDEDLNLDNIDDINMGISQESAQTDLNNIPDVSQEYQQNANVNEINSFENTENFTEQNQYNPDFSSNDQQTIETLYDDNTQNQFPGDTLNQTFEQNHVQSALDKPIQQKKKSSPLLIIVFLAALGTFGYLKKDMIMEQVNTLLNKNNTVVQDQNMPIEGDTAKLNENAEDNSDLDTTKKEIGEIPGESGGPQDVASMEKSLKQKNSDYSSIETLKQKSPEPLNSNSVKRLYWEIPQELTYNDEIVNYLKTAGRAMKFNMQADLLNIHDMPYSNKMIVDVKINKSGNVENAIATVSSGSTKIDNVVLQSVKAALKYVKAPTAEFKRDSYDFSLIINF